MFEISRDTMISEILSNAPEAMPVFQNIGMHCLGCAMASGETLEQACLAHDVDPDEFLEQLRTYLESLSDTDMDQKPAVRRLLAFPEE